MEINLYIVFYSQQKENKKRKNHLWKINIKDFTFFTQPTNQPTYTYVYRNSCEFYHISNGKKIQEKKKIKRMWKNIKSFIYFPHIDNDQNRKEKKRICYNPLSHSSKIDKENKKKNK